MSDVVKLAPRGWISGRAYQYRVEEVAPGIEWREGWPGVMSGSALPYIPYGWKAWRCATGEHRYHRTRAAVQHCAGMLAPRVGEVQIISGEVHLDG
jgi:hypothetical protein